jgi:hypothetical protein
MIDGAIDFAVRNLGGVAAAAAMAGVIVGAIGLVFTGWQLAIHAKVARTAFEDGFAKEYRAVIKDIPTKALLGRKLTPQERVDSLDDFYHYVDLCNEQAYLSETHRISKRTWKEWREGIRGNLSKPEFRRAWSYIAHFSRDAEKGVEEFASLRRVAPPDAYDEANPYIQSGAP